MRPSYRTELHVNPSTSDLRWLEERLREYNISRVGATRRSSFLVKLIDLDGNTAGALFGQISYEWLFVDNLWIAEKSRGQGQGRELLRRAEQEACRNGCGHAWVDTFSFQARGFYEKNGYTVFGELPDYPPGHTRYFLSKSLV